VFSRKKGHNEPVTLSDETNAHYLCEGVIFHKRWVPKVHQFTYKHFMPLIDLDALPQLTAISRWLSVDSFNVFSFNQSDYLADYIQDDESLKERALRVLNEHLINTIDNKALSVKVLAHWRVLGKVFNPITVFYFFHNDKCLYMLSEVSNTPWNERSVYARALQQEGEQEQWACKKMFHVSPFNPMDMMYEWRAHHTRASISLHLQLHHQKERHFDARFAYQKTPLNKQALNRALWKQPFWSFHTVVGIYWQALKLFLKRIPFYNHPDALKEESPRV